MAGDWRLLSLPEQTRTLAVSSLQSAASLHLVYSRLAVSQPVASWSAADFVFGPEYIITKWWETLIDRETTHRGVVLNVSAERFR